MKKLIFIEMAVLSVLLVVAVLISAKMDQPAFSQDNISAGSNATDSTQSIQPDPVQTDPTWNTYPEDRQLTAKQYFVYDCKAGAYLTCSGAENERVYPASITKLFTGYLVMQYLHSDAYIEIGDALDLVVPGSSVAQLQKGDRLTARQLIEAMYITSGNDAAYVLAYEAGRVISGQPDLDVAAAVQAFVEEMNRRAKAYGMTDTHFVNPDGIHDPDHYSTIKDLTTLVTLCMTDNTTMRNAIVPEADIKLQDRTVVWKNTNLLIVPDSPYYCPYALGLKTGQTPEAGSCLLSIFRKDGQLLIIGVFGSASHEERFNDTLQLFNQVVLD